MENPEHEIRPIIRSLCQGTTNEQRRTLDRYFTKDAAFVHPFCIAPSFGEGHIPVLSHLSSRDVMRRIFQWYRMLSPKIDIEIDAALHDKIRDKMYVDIRQTFSVWFLPMYNAHVRLVTVLDLVASDDANFHDPLDRIIRQEETDSERSPTQLFHRGTAVGDNHHRHQHHNGHGPRLWKISRQEDLYQVNEFLKFVGGPGPLPFIWFLFQIQATMICVFMSLFVRLSPWAFQKEPARGGVEAVIETVESYHDYTNEKINSYRHTDEKPDSRSVTSAKNGDDSGTGGLAGGSSATNGHHSHHGHHSRNSHNGSNGQNGHNGNDRHEGHDGIDGTGNGNGRGPANSKVSPTTPPRKQGKSGKKGGGR